MGSASRKDFNLRKKVRENPCCACGQVPGDSFNPIDAAHVKTFNVAQEDVEVNLTALCRQCHQLQHQIGIFSFIKSHPRFKAELLRKGWEIEEHPFENKKCLLIHPEVR